MTHAQSKYDPTIYCLLGCMKMPEDVRPRFFAYEDVQTEQWKKLSGHFINDYVLVRADLGKQRSAVQMVH